MNIYLLAKLQDLEPGFGEITLTYNEEDFCSAIEVIERSLDILGEYCEYKIPEKGDKYFDYDKKWKVAKKDFNKGKRIVLDLDYIPEQEEEKPGTPISFIVQGDIKDIISTCSKAVKVKRTIPRLDIVFVPLDSKLEKVCCKYMDKNFPEISYRLEKKLYEKES